MAALIGLALLAQVQATDVELVAAEAGVKVADLQGAVNSTGLGARAYLVAVGELPEPLPPRPLIVGAVGRADCIISKESGGADVPNRQGSGASGPGQYFPSTWARHTALYRSATGDQGLLSLHALQDVRRVMAYMLAEHPVSRAEWAVGGC